MNEVEIQEEFDVVDLDSNKINLDSNEIQILSHLAYESFIKKKDSLIFPGKSSKKEDCSVISSIRSFQGMSP